MKTQSISLIQWNSTSWKKLKRSIPEELLASWLRYLPAYSNTEIRIHPAINTNEELIMAPVSNGLFEDTLAHTRNCVPGNVSQITLH